jgi:hypothetical protein
MVGLSGSTLAEFAASLHRRVYGSEPTRDAFEARPQAESITAWLQARIASTA